MILCASCENEAKVEENLVEQKRKHCAVLVHIALTSDTIDTHTYGAHVSSLFLVFPLIRRSTHSLRSALYFPCMVYRIYHEFEHTESHSEQPRSVHGIESVGARGERRGNGRDPLKTCMTGAFGSVCGAVRVCVSVYTVSHFEFSLSLTVNRIGRRTTFYRERECDGCSEYSYFFYFA